MQLSRPDHCLLISIDVNKCLESLSEIISRVNHGSLETGKHRGARLEQANELVNQIKAMLVNFKLELQYLEPSGRGRFVEEFKNAVTKFRELESAYQSKVIELDATEEAVKLEILDENMGASDSRAGMDLTQAEKVGDAIQDKTEAQIHHMSRVVAGAQDVGIAVAGELDRQLEQGDRIKRGLDDVEGRTKSGMAKAGKLKPAFYKDKFMLLLLVLNSCSLMAVVLIYALWEKYSYSDTTDSPQGLMKTVREEGAESRLAGVGVLTAVAACISEGDETYTIEFVLQNKLLRGTSSGYLFNNHFIDCVNLPVTNLENYYGGRVW